MTFNHNLQIQIHKKNNTNPVLALVVWARS